MLNDFKTFVLRGNVIDLAVGVAIGVAFTAVVTAFTEHLLTPLLGIPGDVARFGQLTFEIGGAEFRYGRVIDSIVSLLITAAVLFFLVVRPVNAFMDHRKTEPELESETAPCPECLSKIPVAARRCAFCTAEVGVR